MPPFLLDADVKIIPTQTHHLRESKHSQAIALILSRQVFEAVDRHPRVPHLGCGRPPLGSRHDPKASLSPSDNWMIAASRTPVLVGVGVVNQRQRDARKAREPIELMIDATRRAGRDARAPALLGAADYIGVPRGRWTYGDPARLIAAEVGAPRADGAVSGRSVTAIGDRGGLRADIHGRDRCCPDRRWRCRISACAGGARRHHARGPRRRSSAGCAAEATSRPAPSCRAASWAPDADRDLRVDRQRIPGQPRMEPRGSLEPNRRAVQPVQRNSGKQPVCVAKGALESRADSGPVRA
jgi:hypothetical protein